MTLNAALKSFAHESKNIFFVDVGSSLVDAKGNLADMYHFDDGIDLNTYGYNVWIRELRKIIDEALAIMNGLKMMNDPLTCRATMPSAIEPWESTIYV